MRWRDLVRALGARAVEEGGRLAYGPRLNLAYRHVAELAAKIRNGARPENPPVEQVEKLDFVVNLKSARAAGIVIPLSLLARAGEVIE